MDLALYLPAAIQGLCCAYLFSSDILLLRFLLIIRYIAQPSLSLSCPVELFLLPEGCPLPGCARRVPEHGPRTALLISCWQNRIRSFFSLVLETVEELL